MEEKKQTISKEKLLIGFISALGVSFLVVEMIDFPNYFKTFLSFLLIGGELYLLHLSIKGGRVMEMEMYFAFALLVIVNRLYDPKVFETYFKFPLANGAIIICILFIIRILLPILANLYRGRVKKKNTNKENKIEEKVSGTSYTKEYPKGIVKSKGERENFAEQKVKAPVQKKVSLSEKLLIIVFLTLNTVFTYMFIKNLTSISSISMEQAVSNINSLIPLALVILLSTVITFVLLCAYIKMIKIMINVLRGNDSVAIYVVGIIVISFFLTNTGYFNQDIMLSLITQGDIFSLPIAALLIYAIFILSSHAIDRILKDKKVYEKMIDKASSLSKRVLKIGYDCINSCISLIEFVSSDLLENMVSILKDDNEEEETDE